MVLFEKGYAFLDCLRFIVNFFSEIFLDFTDDGRRSD
jgi:hypothetical protein